MGRGGPAVGAAVGPEVGAAARRSLPASRCHLPRPGARGRAGERERGRREVRCEAAASLPLCLLPSPPRVLLARRGAAFSPSLPR